MKFYPMKTLSVMMIVSFSSRLLCGAAHGPNLEMDNGIKYASEYSTTSLNNSVRSGLMRLGFKVTPDHIDGSLKLQKITFLGNLMAVTTRSRDFQQGFTHAAVNGAILDIPQTKRALAQSHFISLWKATLRQYYPENASDFMDMLAYDEAFQARICAGFDRNLKALIERAAENESAGSSAMDTSGILAQMPIPEEASVELEK